MHKTWRWWRAWPSTSLRWPITSTTNSYTQYKVNRLEWLNMIRKIFKPYREDPLWDRSWLQILKRNGPWSALSKCLQCLLHPLTGHKRVRCKLPASDQQHGTSPCCWMHSSLSVYRCSHAWALFHIGHDGSDRWTPEPKYPTEQREKIESVEYCYFSMLLVMNIAI